MQKYSVNQYPVSTILGWVQSGEIAIPEIQRPFVWDSVKVRDLMDSLYRGYPIGYLVVWRNPNVRLKDGSLSAGKKILIDGQQRVASLRAAILGENITNKEYKEVRIYIAFHPIKEEFATLTPAIAKDNSWVKDIAEFLKGEDIFTFVENYCEQNPKADRKIVGQNIQKLLSIKNKPVGFIELAEDLDIDTVTEIFIRINSKGVVLSQADFVMSKIASYGDFGANLRKSIDYFCHLSREPKAFKNINENDQEYIKTDYFPKMVWLRNENDNLYDPDYADVIRTCFTYQFSKGKLSELVSLLSGRNFETRKFEQQIMDNSFKKLREGVLDFINETNFKRFVMIIKSAGFIDPALINSQNSLNFAYSLYLKLREKKANSGLIEKYVRRWFVMSVLTGRYSASADTNIDRDIKSIAKDGIKEYLQSIEDADMSDTFWNVGLVQKLNRSNITSPQLSVFFAAQIKANDKGFLSSDITVRDMVLERGDIHHIFPKNYLRKKYPSKSDYNQIANFVYAQTEINIKIGDRAPKDYFKDILDQCNGKSLKYGNIADEDSLKQNLRRHCVPENVADMTDDDYPAFLAERRKLIAKRIERYYKNL